jgi:NADH:ubiquinone oxidoreductase subunit 5 (subunit L)/multisubunit Na+/H+ antiporter MnhA subunit
LTGLLLDNSDASDPGSKAILVNCVCDFCFLLALLLMYKTFQSFDLSDVLPAAAQPAEAGRWGQFAWIGALFLAGSTGKLTHILLNFSLFRTTDNMARISAGGVTAALAIAGVYVIARSSAFYLNSPKALLMSAAIGTALLLYAAAKHHQMLVRPLIVGVKEILWNSLDRMAIQGSVDQIARGWKQLGDVARRIQSGNVRSYAAWVTLGALLAAGFMLVVAA